MIRMLGLGLFAAALALVPLRQWLGPVAINHENRELASLPAFPASSEAWLAFPGAFSDYMNDNFGFRSDLLRTHNRLLMALGTSPSDKVVLGKSGWLYYEHLDLTDQNRGAMALSPRWLERYLAGFRNQRRWSERQGALHLLLPVPDKNTLFPRYLPETVKQVGPSRYEQVLGFLRDRDEPFVNVLPLLTAARDRGERIYLQTDTHWSCLGAFRAYEALMDDVERLGLPGVRRVTESDIQFTELGPTPGGDMARNMLLLDDIVQEHLDVSCKFVSPPDVRAVRISDGFEAKDPFRQRSQQQRWRYTLQDPPRTRLLLVRDSYAHALIPYLILSFDEVIVVPRRRMEWNRADFTAHQPDIVIYQFVERALRHIPRIRRDEQVQ